MAIVYIKELDDTKIHLSFNNIIVSFYTDNTEDITNATIQVGLDLVTLYPDPNGVFYYNLKDLINSKLNTSNYADDLDTDLSSAYVYDWTDEISLTDDIVITINFANDTTETDTVNLTFLSGYVNLRKWKQTYPASNLLTTGIDLLQKSNGDSYHDYKLNYWYGYPFDFTLYSNSQSITMTNNVNLSSFILDTGDKKISRTVFSDGRTDVNIEDDFSIANGYNDIDFNGVFNIHLNKITDFCTDGIYIKWINSLGGWNYWLFSKGKESISTKERGALMNDFNALEDTTSPFISLGKSSEESIQVRQQRLKEQEKIFLEDLLDSAKVYLFTGVPFSKNTFNDWVEVNLKSGKFTTLNPRGGLYDFKLTLELPTNITREL